MHIRGSMNHEEIDNPADCLPSVNRSWWLEVIGRKAKAVWVPDYSGMTLLGVGYCTCYTSDAKEFFTFGRWIPDSRFASWRALKK